MQLLRFLEIYSEIISIQEEDSDFIYSYSGLRGVKIRRSNERKKEKGA